MSETSRWRMRFENYSRAVRLLGEAVAEMRVRELSVLEKEGCVQRFEVAMELAWKVMRDYLESRNVVFDEITPRQVIKGAVAANLVADGQVWMNALDARNKMSHTYDAVQFETVIVALRSFYYPAMESLYAILRDRADADDAP